MSRGNEEQGIKRRTVLGSLSAAGAMGLAGCGDILGGGNGNGGPGNGQDPEDLGERVPTQTLQHYTGWYQHEQAGEALDQQLPDRLGLDVEIEALDVATAVGNVFTDNRFSSMPIYYISNTQDGTTAWERYQAPLAGNPGGNVSQWVNCPYTVLIREQRKVPDQEKRQEVLHHAQSIRSNDLAVINLGLPFDNTWAYRPDQMEIDEDEIGTGTLFPLNTGLYSTIEPVGDREFIEIADNQTFYYRNTNVYSNEDQSGPWQNLIHSKLFYVDLNNDEPGFMNSNIAESVDISDDGLEYTVELDPNATFHNGDQVTAEDVKFSYEYLAGNPDIFLDAPEVELEVEAVDDTTAVFQLEEPYAPLVTRDFHTWAILHRDTWVEAGALEDPEGARPDVDDIVGSGPFEINSFTPGEGMTIEPYTDHHTFDPHPDAKISFNVFTDTTSLFESLRSGDLSAGITSPPQRRQIREQDDLSDQLNIAAGESTVALILVPQWPLAPTKFFEFREAVAMAINYEEIEALTTLGEREPDIHAETTAPSHPNRAPEDMLYEQGNGNLSGDPEAARQVLTDAGWGWDNDGNLHYPPDADLSPRWEAEGNPDPSDYPCLDENDEYVRPPDDQIDLPIDLDDYVVDPNS